MKNVTYYNAGAGSGKTYTLTHKLAELIKSGLNPSEVILTTFTTNAAEDFRERARSVLYNEGLHEKAALLDQAVIGTVHSIANDFIHRYWYLLGLSPEMNVMDDDSTKFYIDQSLSALPTQEDLKLFREFQRAFDLAVFDGLSYKPDEMFWKKWLNEIIGKVTSYRIASLKVSAEYSIKQLREIFSPNADFELSPMRFISVLERIRDIASTEASGKGKERLLKANEYLALNHWEIHHYANLSKLLDSLPQNYSKQLQELDNLKAITSNIWHSNQVFELISKVVLRIFALAEEWGTLYEEYKQEKRIIDYNDMEKYMLKLLTDPNTKKIVETEIRSRYRCLMVDEFQDSSPIQVDIFNYLSRLVEQSYWCGDSKQAIYGFRGSDTELIEAVVNMIPEQNVNILDTSYRSEPHIVELCNALFIRAFEEKLPPHKVELKVHRKKKTVGPNLIHWASAYTNKKDFIHSLSNRIENFTTDYDVAYKDIAVLARSNDELNILSTALRNDGIPVNHATGSLLQQKETELIISILTLIIDKRNKLAKAKIAYLTEKGYHLGQIIDSKLGYDDKHKEDEEKRDEWLNELPLVNKIMTLRREWSNQSVTAQIESVIIELNLRSILKSWGYWQYREANLYQIMALAEKYEQHCQVMTLGTTTTGFLNYLKTNESVAAGDGEGVVLSTYHGSKGLEWKNVILLSLDNNDAEDRKIVSRSVFGVQKVRTSAHTRENLFPEMMVSLMPYVFGNRSNPPEDIYTQIRESEYFKNAQKDVIDESARLLYVGMTRAKDRLITTSKKKGRGVSDPFAWLSNLIITSASADQEGKLDLFKTGLDFEISLSNQNKGEEEAIEEDIPVYDLRMDENEQNAKFSSKYIAPSQIGIENKGSVALVASSGKRIPMKGNPNMDEVGTCLHNIYAAYSECKEEDKLMAQRMIRAFNFSEVLPDIDAIIDARCYLSTYLCNNFGKGTTEYHELPFMHKQEGQIVRGSMDLVWETSDGCVLVDFKSFPGVESEVTNTDSKFFAGKYKPQFDCYRAALEAVGKKTLKSYVYYPVNGMIVEI